jgi:altronate hydrolase
MSDIIDIDAGPIVRGEKTVQQVGEIILERIVSTASGKALTKAESKNQEDFIPWKRGVSL